MKPQRDMKELARVITKAREAKGWSARKLEEQCGLHHSFISKLEAAKYESVSNDSLMALSQALDLPPEDLFTLAGFKLPESLPSFRPYLRARYGEELPEGARAALNELFNTLKRSYHGSDEIDDEGKSVPSGGRS